MPKKSKPKEDELLPAEKGIPRFVVSITDTQTVVGGQYYSINAGADNLDEFNRLIPKKKRTNEARTELQNMFWHMKQAVKDFDEQPYKKIDENNIDENEN